MQNFIVEIKYELCGVDDNKCAPCPSFLCNEPGGNRVIIQIQHHINDKQLYSHKQRVYVFCIYRMQKVVTV